MRTIPDNIIIGTASGVFDTAAEARAAIEHLDRLGLVLVERRFVDLWNSGNHQHVLYWGQM